MKFLIGVVILISACVTESGRDDQIMNKEGHNAAKQEKKQFSILEPNQIMAVNNQWVYKVNYLTKEERFKQSDHSMNETDYLDENKDKLVFDLIIEHNPIAWTIEPNMTIADQVSEVFAADAANIALTDKMCLLIEKDTLLPFMAARINEGGMKNRLYYQIGFTTKQKNPNNLQLCLTGLPTDTSSVTLQF